MASSRAVRDIRVCLAEGDTRFRIRIDGAFLIRKPNGTIIRQGRGLDWTEVSAQGGIVLGRSRLGARVAEFVPRGSGALLVSRWQTNGWAPARRYGGWLRCQVQKGGALQAVNVVDVETYVAGVVCGELPASFHREAFRAQAVAARTYALYHMAGSENLPFDVSDTEASQVYVGLAGDAGYRQARSAADDSRGVVCTWSSSRGLRIFCTYYSSCCGGRTRRGFDNGEVAVRGPLRGGVRCEYCRIAGRQVYRWGPTRLAKRELAARLWSRHPQFTSLGEVRRVAVAERDEFARPVRIRVTGAEGNDALLAAEGFRLAVGSRVMRSADCRIIDAGDEIVLTDGRGFGHGMGLCQWGMEGQARQGRTAAHILYYYYPGAQLARVY